MINSNKSGIYCITNIINKKYYIGRASNFKIRYKKHLNDLRKSKHCNKYLQNAFNKYGEDNFEFKIIEICEKEDYKELEQKYLNEVEDWDSCYNLSKSAEGGCGLHTDETKAKMSAAHTGRMHPEEVKAKIGVAQTGDKHHNYGKKTPDEVKAKISATNNGKRTGEENSMFGKKHTAEAKAKLSAATTGKKNPRYISPIAIYNIITNERKIANSENEVAFLLNCSQASVNYRLNKSSSNYTENLIHKVWKVYRIEKSEA